MSTDTEAGLDVQRDAVDWDELDAGALRVGRRTQGFLLALLLLGAAFLYYRFTKYSLMVGAWYTPSRLDWLFLLSLVVFVFYVVVPLATHRERTLRYWRRFRRNRLAVVCLLYLGVFLVVGTASLLFLGRPEPNIAYSFQPPLLFTAEQGTTVRTCAGTVTGPATDMVCHGSPRFPFGTDDLGRSVVGVVATGMGVSLLVALVTSMLIVPIATLVGVVAGYFGGRVDTLLMRYVDIQQTVPAFLLYVLMSIAYGQSLFLIILAFGLLSWGGVARLVRSEVKQRRGELYVTAAESAGASRLQLVRRHILPNVSSTVVTAITRQIPLLILTEAAISFIATLGDENVPSWGQQIATMTAQPRFPEAWWLSIFPLTFLVVTVFSFSVVGDALRDTLDPRGET